MNGNAGYWTAFGAPASVDWCEPNYVHSAFIAEWWNTLSCLPMALLGLYGLWCVIRDDRIEGRFFVCFAALTLVAIGSIAFHSTILQFAQAMDELPMIYGGLAFAFCLANHRHTDHTRARRWRIGLVAYATVFTVAYFSLTSYFTFFIWSYAGIVTILVLGSGRIAWGPMGSRMHRRLIMAGAGLFVGAVFLLWIPEHVLLACDHPLQGLQLHALWHMAAGLGAYLGFLFMLWNRLGHLGLQPRLRFSRLVFIPSVIPSPSHSAATETGR